MSMGSSAVYSSKFAVKGTLLKTKRVLAFSLRAKATSLPLGLNAG